MNGFLVVDKPGGITSHDVVDRVRRALGERRVGHAGTLDPSASGVLLMGIGQTTRLLRFLEAHEKEYRARVVLGETTTTQDAEGEIVATADASAVTREAVERALEPLRGTIQQVPPMVSAVKVGGERLYRKALRGEEIERAPRTVVVHELVLEQMEPGKRAHAMLRVVCGRGTYVRALAADLGQALGVGAHLEALRRTRIGSFVLGDAVPLDRVAPESVRPVEDAVAGYPRRTLSDDDVGAVVHGRALPAAGIEGPYAAFGPDRLIAMMEDRGEEARSLCVLPG